VSEQGTEECWPDRGAAVAGIIAAGLVCSSRRMTEWRRAGGPVPAPGCAIPKAPLLAWARERERQPAGRPPKAGAQEMDKAKLRRITAQCRKMELEIDALKRAAAEGNTIPATEARAIMVAAMTDIKASLLQDLPIRVVELAREHGTEDAIDAIRDAITKALLGLSVASERLE
jgi:hypothetical protein